MQPNIWVHVPPLIAAVLTVSRGFIATSVKSEGEVLLLWMALGSTFQHNGNFEMSKIVSTGIHLASAVQTPREMIRDQGKEASVSRDMKRLRAISHCTN